MARRQTEKSRQGGCDRLIQRDSKGGRREGGREGRVTCSGRVHGKPAQTFQENERFFSLEPGGIMNNNGKNV